MTITEYRVEITDGRVRPRNPFPSTFATEEEAIGAAETYLSGTANAAEYAIVFLLTTRDGQVVSSTIHREVHRPGVVQYWWM